MKKHIYTSPESFVVTAMPVSMIAATTGPQKTNLKWAAGDERTKEEDGDGTFKTWTEIYEETTRLDDDELG